ncbi:uncharacterized protein L201_003118 [Kwoniella dendrophila CBS 6074]|uniref:Rrn9 domain-containing protein n=1 Tax=Kwoniella dendrophila CBS 6074 TaxID=1295534 RepID=A0AAX4JUM3_9TREE
MSPLATISQSPTTSEEYTKLSQKLFNPKFKNPRIVKQPCPPSLSWSKLPPPAAEIDERPNYRIRRFKLWKAVTPELRKVVLDPRKRFHLRRYQSYVVLSEPSPQVRKLSIPLSKNEEWSWCTPVRKPPEVVNDDDNDTGPALYPNSQGSLDDDASKSNYHRNGSTQHTSHHSPLRKLPNSEIYWLPPLPPLDKLPWTDKSISKKQRKLNYQYLLENKWILDQETEKRFRIAMGIKMEEIMRWQRENTIPTKQCEKGKNRWKSNVNIQEIKDRTEFFKSIRKKSTNILKYTDNLTHDNVDVFGIVPFRDRVNELIKIEDERKKIKKQRKEAKKKKRNDIDKATSKEDDDGKLENQVELDIEDEGRDNKGKVISIEQATERVKSKRNEYSNSVKMDQPDFINVHKESPSSTNSSPPRNHKSKSSSRSSKSKKADPPDDDLSLNKPQSPDNKSKSMKRYHTYLRLPTQLSTESQTPLPLTIEPTATPEITYKINPWEYTNRTNIFDLISQMIISLEQDQQHNRAGTGSKLPEDDNDEKEQSHQQQQQAEQQSETDRYLNNPIDGEGKIITPGQVRWDMSQDQLLEHQLPSLESNTSASSYRTEGTSFPGYSADVESRLPAKMVHSDLGETDIDSNIESHIARFGSLNLDDDTMLPCSRSTSLADIQQYYFTSNTDLPSSAFSRRGKSSRSYSTGSKSDSSDDHLVHGYRSQSHLEEQKLPEEDGDDSHDTRYTFRENDMADQVTLV